jgi:hypothetical protein
MSKKNILFFKIVANNKLKSILAMTSLFVVIIYPLIINTNNNYAFGAHPTMERNGIVLVGMQTEPSVVHVGDNFTIHATLVRYSPYGLEIWNNFCAGPLQAKFDKNVKIFDNGVSEETGQSSCPANVRVMPTSIITPVSTPVIAGDKFNPSTDHFKATSAGITNATLYLEYNVLKGEENQTKTFDRNNAKLISCFEQNKIFSPCSFKFAILP